MRSRRAFLVTGLLGLALGACAWEVPRLVPELEIPRLSIVPASFVLGLIGIWNPRFLRGQAAAPGGKSRASGILAWTLLFAVPAPWFLIRFVFRDAPGARYAIVSAYGSPEFYIYEAFGFDSLRPIVYQREWLWRREVYGSWPGYYAIELFGGETYTLGSHQVKLARDGGRPRAWIDGTEAYVSRLDAVAW